MSQIVVGGHHLIFCSHGKKYKMWLTFALAEKTIIPFIVIDFVRYSEGQEINNTTMTQQLRLHEIIWGTHKIGMYSLYFGSMWRKLRVGPENISDQVAWCTISRRGLSSNRYLNDVPEHGGLRIKQNAKIK